MALGGYTLATAVVPMSNFKEKYGRTPRLRTATAWRLKRWHGAMNLLDINIEIMTTAHVADCDRIAMVDVQPHYFGGEIDRVDLVIDHHPEQSGYTAVYKDIRVDYGSTEPR